MQPNVVSCTSCAMSILFLLHTSCIQVTQSTKFEDLIGSVSPGTLYAKWVTSREPEQKAKPSEEEDLEYYL
jgi:hypothetical protein